MKNSKKKLLMALGMIFALCVLLSISGFAASTRKCYLIKNQNTVVYKNTGLSKKLGTIYGSDEIIVKSVSSSYCKVTYPTRLGTKTGYISTSAILTATTGKTYTAKAKITTYRRPGGTSYGYIAKGDSVKVLGTSGSYTQVKYPVSGGYKYAFITTSSAKNYITGTTGVSNGCYTIYSALSSNKVVDAYNNGNTNGTNIQLYQSNGTNAQKYNITSLGNGWYKICNVNSLALDVEGGVAKSNVNVQLYQWNNSYAQHWRFIDAGNGYYYIQNRLGYYLDVAGGKTANGTNIAVYSGNGTNAQKFRLVSTTAGSTTSDSTLASPVASGCKFSKKTWDNGWYGYHDINRNVYKGMPVYAIADGTITCKQAYRTIGGKKYLTSYGNFIVFTSDSSGYTAKYCHLNSFAGGVSQKISSSMTRQISGSAGTYTLATRTVKKGEIIGYIGTTGNSSGVHLHFELFQNGKRLDPTSIFSGLK